MNLFAESTGHFVDRAVGKVTDLEKGDQVADAVASAIEFIALIGVFAVPILVLLSSARRRGNIFLAWLILRAAKRLLI